MVMAKAFLLLAIPTRAVFLQKSSPGACHRSGTCVIHSCKSRSLLYSIGKWEQIAPSSWSENPRPEVLYSPRLWMWARETELKIPHVLSWDVSATAWTEPNLCRRRVRGACTAKHSLPNNWIQSPRHLIVYAKIHKHEKGPKYWMLLVPHISDRACTIYSTEAHSVMIQLAWGVRARAGSHFSMFGSKWALMPSLSLPLLFLKNKNIYVCNLMPWHTYTSYVT